MEPKKSQIFSVPLHTEVKTHLSKIKDDTTNDQFEQWIGLNPLAQITALDRL
jgi:hypothetical protein